MSWWSIGVGVTLRSAIELSRYVAGADIHNGWEKVYKGGRFVTQRADNPAATSTFLSFVKDYQPDTVVLLGDQLNASSISHWNDDKPRNKEGIRLIDEMDLHALEVLDMIDRYVPNARRIWHKGNHERFIDDFLLKHPELEGIVDPVKYLRLKDRGWEVYDHKELSRVGKVYFTHGEYATGKYHARRMLDLYQRNIRYGHRHTYEVAIGTSAADQKDFHTAVAVPCLANLNPSYAQNKPNNWINGFLWGENTKSGAFTDQVAIMVDNKYLFGGKVYE